MQSLFLLLIVQKLFNWLSIVSQEKIALSIEVHSIYYWEWASSGSSYATTFTVFSIEVTVAAFSLIRKFK